MSASAFAAAPAARGEDVTTPLPASAAGSEVAGSQEFSPGTAAGRSLSASLSRDYGSLGWDCARGVSTTDNLKVLLLKALLKLQQNGGNGGSSPAGDPQKDRLICEMQALLQAQREGSHEATATGAGAFEKPKDGEKGEDSSYPQTPQSPGSLLRMYRENLKVMDIDFKSLKEERSLLKKQHAELFSEHKKLDVSLQLILKEIEELKERERVEVNTNVVLMQFIVTVVRLLLDALVEKKSVDAVLLTLRQELETLKVSSHPESLLSECYRSLRNIIEHTPRNAGTSDASAGAEKRREERCSRSACGVLLRVMETHTESSIVQRRAIETVEHSRVGEKAQGEAETAAGAKAAELDASAEELERSLREQRAKAKQAAMTALLTTPAVGEAGSTIKNGRRQSEMPRHTARLELAPPPHRADSDGSLVVHGPALERSARRLSATAVGDGAFSLAAQFAVAARAPAPREEHTPVLLPEATSQLRGPVRENCPLAPVDCSPAFLAAETAAAPGVLPDGGEGVEASTLSKATLKRDAREAETVQKPQPARGEGPWSGEPWVVPVVEGQRVSSADQQASASFEGLLSHNREALSSTQKDIRECIEVLRQSPQVRPLETKSAAGKLGNAGEHHTPVRGGSAASCGLPETSETTTTFVTELLRRANSVSVSLAEVRRALGEVIGFEPEGAGARGSADGQGTTRSFYSIPPTPLPTHNGSFENTLSFILARAATRTDVPRDGFGTGGSSDGESDANEKTSKRPVNEDRGLASIYSRRSLGDSVDGLGQCRTPVVSRVDQFPSGPCGLPWCSSWSGYVAAPEGSVGTRRSSASFDGSLLTPQPSRVSARGGADEAPVIRDGSDSVRSSQSAAGEEPARGREAIDLVAAYKAMLALEQIQRKEHEVKTAQVQVTTTVEKKVASQRSGGVERAELRQVAAPLPSSAAGSLRGLSSPVAAATPSGDAQGDGTERHAAPAAAPQATVPSVCAFESLVADEGDPKEGEAELTGKKLSAEAVPDRAASSSHVRGDSVGKASIQGAVSKAVTSAVTHVAASDARATKSVTQTVSRYEVESGGRIARVKQLRYPSRIQVRHSRLPSPVAVVSVPCEEVSYAPYAVPVSALALPPQGVATVAYSPAPGVSAAAPLVASSEATQTASAAGASESAHVSQTAGRVQQMTVSQATAAQAVAYCYPVGTSFAYVPSYANEVPTGAPLAPSGSARFYGFAAEGAEGSAHVHLAATVKAANAFPATLAPVCYREVKENDLPGARLGSTAAGAGAGDDESKMDSAGAAGERVYAEFTAEEARLAEDAGKVAAFVPSSYPTQYAILTAASLPSVPEESDPAARGLDTSRISTGGWCCRPTNPCAKK
ncbi:hypothetical protein BESB_083120 [Besnoitia besnoiti]|uniref:Uncharacterized protein n=1 Tax=Besnoitia besnoiti TaxID=94643 RepID=A0A2A9MBQ8_BESBE|nr:hypothetical protein BESB_083120 [Besnoitia besnoiti]PFH33113.1 hypothetical protein BESB_083120 [Besnoitia besnoiti]